MSDDFVRFANNYLGYACSPQNVRAFLDDYNCMHEAAMAKVCALSQFQPKSIFLSHTLRLAARTMLAGDCTLSNGARP
jgi:hypothetical protein